MIYENIIYEAFNEPVLQHIPATAKRILDVGCGNGILGKKIKENQQIEITGITYSEDEAVLAREHLDKVLVADLNTFELIGAEQFDCIIFSHVLEHLYQPDEVLKRFRNNLNEKGTLIVALPNVLFYKQRLKFLKGNFKYTEGGLMDSTHFRFFDYDTARLLVKNAGFNILTSDSWGVFPLPGFRKILPAFASRVDKYFLKAFPNLFGWQVVISANK